MSGFLLKRIGRFSLEHLSILPGKLAFNRSEGRYQKREFLLGFWYGHKLNDRDRFLSHGTNKQVFYKVYQTPEEIDEKPIKELLKEAIKLDSTFKKVS